MKKVAKFGITQKIYVHRLRRNRKIISNNPVQKNKRICFDVDALSSSDNNDSWLNTTSSSGDKGEE